MADTHTDPDSAEDRSSASDPAPSDATPRAVPLMPVPDGVVYPEMVVTVALESDESQAAAAAATDNKIALVPRIDGRFLSVGA
ncbi:MAG: hypothetical protein ACR2PK_09115, partial [Acidimicrobiales bacterium]